MAKTKKVQDEVMNNEAVETEVKATKSTTKPKVKKTANESEKEISKDNHFEEENKKLKNEIDELKAMMMQLINNQNQQPKENVSPQEDELELQEEYEDIDLKKLINVTNLFDGEMTLYGMHNAEIKFGGFGVTRPLTYENIIQIVGNYNKWAKAGLFYIHDKKVIKAQMLEEDYKYCLTKDQIVNFINNSETKMKEILSKISPEIKETIKYVVARGINSGDPRYLDRNKMATIEEILKVSLRDFADGLR